MLRIAITAIILTTTTAAYAQHRRHHHPPAVEGLQKSSASAAPLYSNNDFWGYVQDRGGIYPDAGDVAPSRPEPVWGANNRLLGYRAVDPNGN